MSRPKRDTPAMNYAKPVQDFKMSSIIQERLSNKLGGDGSKLSNDQRSYKKTYQILHNKAYYQGEWKGGLPNGKGICKYQDGTYVQGNFEDGTLNDLNAFILLPNGAKYRGNVKDSQPQGSGKLQKGSYSYTGQWRNGKPHGKGKQVYEDNSYYDGTFVDGVKQCFDSSKTIQQKKQYFQKHGKLPIQSFYKTSNDQIYNGQFKNGLMHGFGEYYQAINEIRYCGQFKQGKKKGDASLYTSSGTLSGVFEDDVVNGKGQYIWNDKRRYEGQFKDNQFHGKGKIYMPNGTILQGEWVEGHSKQLKNISRQFDERRI